MPASPLPVLALAFALSPPLGATPAYDFTPVTAIVQQANADLSLRGASLRVLIDGQLAYQQFFGTYTASTIVPIASATKTLSAAVIMALVDEGKLSLDDKVAKYIPSFNKPGGYADITIRQCFSHTSGIPGSEDDNALSNSSITLAQSADMIAQYALIGPPGGQYAYGGLSMQVAGRCAEVAGGKTWDQLFQEKITVPLGLTQVDFTTVSLFPPYRTTTNPRIAGGARCSLGDFAIFSQMLLNHGLHNGRRILSEASVREMERDQVVGIPVISSPMAPAPTHYGIGTWIDLSDAAGQPIQTSADGAFGFSGWVDRPHRIAAAFLVLDSFQAVRPYLLQMQTALRNIVDNTPPSAADAATRLANLSVRTAAGEGGATLIAGFVVNGGPRNVVARGIGPGLAGFGVPGVLADPVLTLFKGASPVESNDDWSTDDGRGLGAFPLTSGSMDAVLSAILAPSAYTAQVTPHTGTATGEALAEIYDAGGGAGRLTNLSARTALATGGTTIAGFVVTGAPGSLRKVLIRAAGPALIPFGVPGTLADPRLELFNGTAVLIAANDNWSGTSALSATFASVSAFDFVQGTSRDAALVVALPPGNYTAHVSGADSAGGVALVEVYELP